MKSSKTLFNIQSDINSDTFVPYNICPDDEFPDNGIPKNENFAIFCPHDESLFTLYGKMKNNNRFYSKYARIPLKDQLVYS